MGLTVERLPGDRQPKPVWLWVSKPVPGSVTEVDHWWSMFMRRFDLEHTFRFVKQTLGWTRARLRDPESADRWTWLTRSSSSTSSGSTQAAEQSGDNAPALVARFG